MKKFWNMVLVAMVAMGAAACTNDQVESVGPTEEGVSFYAEFVNNDGTRAYIDDTDGDKTWNTIWEQGDILQVSADAVQFYNFEYDSEKGKFTCNTEGVTSLVGQTVDISAYMGGNLDSKAGKKAWNCQGTEVDNFANSDEPVQLIANTSFLRYTYNGDGDVTFSIKVTDVDPIPFVFQYDKGFYEEVTISGVEGENFVAFWTQSHGSVEATLSYSIDGVECKTANLSLAPGKIYNLGTLDQPSAWSVVGEFQGWDAANGVKMYMEGDYFVARNVANLNGGFKFVKDASWGVSKGAKTGSARIGNRWYKVGDNNITLTDADKYDLYLHKDLEKYVIVEAGSALPEENYDYKVYMLNTINWATTNLYCWYNEDNKDTQCTGGWPGTASTTKVTFGEHEYVAFTPTGAADKYIKVIFNNGSAQTQDLSTSEIFDRDMFFEVHAKSAGKPARYITNPESPEKAKSYTIKVKNENSWGGLHIHYWDSVAESSWPGVAMTLEGDRYVYTFGSDFDGESVDMLFNYNGDDAKKTNDLTNIALTCDRYFTIKKDSKEVWWE